MIDSKGTTSTVNLGISTLSDEDVVRRVIRGETELYEIIMRRYNQRLFRIARAILRNGDEAMDVTQDAYVRAYSALSQFAGEAQFSTWLCKIAVHEASRRSRKERRLQSLDEQPGEIQKLPGVMKSSDATPEQQALHRQTAALIEQVIDSLPDRYRPVFVLREVESLSTAETAACLQITEEAVRVRLLRARRFLREELYVRTGASSSEAFRFGAAHCDEVVRNVLQRIRQLPLNDTATSQPAEFRS